MKGAAPKIGAAKVVIFWQGLEKETGRSEKGRPVKIENKKGGREVRPYKGNG
jgi:hypothetical protein